jgi:hypothetical protein
VRKNDEYQKKMYITVVAQAKAHAVGFAVAYSEL